MGLNVVFAHVADEYSVVLQVLPHAVHTARLNVERNQDGLIILM